MAEATENPIVNSIANNPFLNSTALPHGAAPFDKMTPENFLPALASANSRAQQELDRIANDPAAPTFKNTIEAYEFSTRTFSRLLSIYYTVSGADNTPEIRKLGGGVSNEVYNFQKEVSIDTPKLFARVKKVYDTRNTLNLSPLERALLEKTYSGFVRDGALLSKEDKQKLDDINTELGNLSATYQSNINASTLAYKKVIDNEADLAGVSDRYKAFYQQQAEAAGMPGKWLITLSPPPDDIRLNARNRALREEISKAMGNVANEGKYDNRPIVLQIIKLRQQEAKLLGYDNYASYVLDGSMMGNTKNALDFLEKSIEAKAASVEEYVQKVRDLAKKTEGITDLQPSDFDYYAGRVKRETFKASSAVLLPYFEVNHVIDGARKHYEKLFNVEMTETQGKYPVYDPDVRVYEVKDKTNGKLIGLYYADYFARPGLKPAGAWTGAVNELDTSQKNELPAAHSTFDFPHPAPNQPTLLSPPDAQTVFHEFGHAMSNLLSQEKYNSLSGTHLAQDFIELPSTLQENWALQKEVLKAYAVNYKTGEPIPDNLIQFINDLIDFDAGYNGLQQAYLGLLDMKWHMADPATIKSVDDFENRVKKEVPELLLGDTHRTTNFAHVFAGGYAATYYSYDWTRALGDDIFKAFKEKGLYDPATSKKLRDTIYTKGATEGAADIFTEMTGHRPDPSKLFQDEAKQMTAKQTQMKPAARVARRPVAKGKLKV